MIYGFDYKKYFENSHGNDSAGFPKNSESFRPDFEKYLVYEIDHLPKNEIRINFQFFGGKGKASLVDGMEACFFVKVKFVGTILCKEVISVSEGSTDDTEKVSFTFVKKFWGGKKVVNIENPLVGKVVIQCKKMYAENLECYFQTDEGYENMGYSPQKITRHEYEKAKKIVIHDQRVSTAQLQRHIGIGYSKALRLIELLEENGVVGQKNGSKSREVLIKME